MKIVRCGKNYKAFFRERKINKINKNAVNSHNFMTKISIKKFSIDSSNNIIW